MRYGYGDRFAKRKLKLDGRNLKKICMVFTKGLSNIEIDFRIVVSCLKSEKVKLIAKINSFSIDLSKLK